jgi:hypothetical protein
VTETPDRPEVDDPRVLALAEARQQMAHDNPFNVVCPPWDGLSEQEQHLSLLDARNYLCAALKAGLVPTASSAVPAPAADRAALVEIAAQAMREHYLVTDREEADADGNLPCRCGDWREPGAEVDDENDWDSHLADAVLAVLPATTDRAAVAAERDSLGREADRLRKDWVKMRTRAESAEAAIERVRRLHDGLDAETDLTSPADELTRGAAARKIAAALDGWTDPAVLRRMADETPQPEQDCPHCPDGHTPPTSGSQPWSAWVTSDRDGDGQPMQITVARSAGAHVAESDAQWVRDVLNGRQRDIRDLTAERDRLAFLFDENTRRHNNTIARVDELLASEQAAKQAEAVLARVRAIAERAAYNVQRPAARLARRILAELPDQEACLPRCPCRNATAPAVVAQPDEEA